MKNVSLLACILAFAAPVFAQDVPNADAPVVGDTPAIEAPTSDAVEPDATPVDSEVVEEAAAAVTEPEVSAAGAEPEVSEPEPEVSEPEPEVSEPEPEVSDSGEDLGNVDPDAVQTAVNQDLGDAVADDDDADDDAGSGGGTLSAAERAASVTGGQGLPWVFPMSWTNNVTVRTFAPGAQLTYDPTFSMSFAVAPRWIFSPRFSIGARQTLDVELTNSSYTPESQDLEWGDLQFDATFPLPWRPGGVSISPSIIARLPTSQLSRHQNRYFGPTARILFIKPFSVLDGLVTGLSLGYTGWIGGSSRRLFTGTSGVDGNVQVPGVPDGVVSRDAAGAPDCTRAFGDTSNAGAQNAAATSGSCAGGNQVRHQTSVAAFASLIPTSGLSINLSFAWITIHNRPHDPSYLPTDQVVTADGQPLEIGDNSPTHMTHITSLSLGVSYDLASYLTVGLSYSTLAFYPDSDATVENAFYNENSQLNLSVSFRPAALVVSLKPPSDDATAAAALSRVAF